MDNTKEFREQEGPSQEQMMRMSALTQRAMKMFPTADKFLDAMEGWITDREHGFSFTVDLGGEE